MLYVCMYVLIRQQDMARHPTQPDYHPLTYRFGSRRAHKVVQLRHSHHLRRCNQGAQGMSVPSSRRSQGSSGLLRCISSLAPSSAYVCLAAVKVAPLASAYAPCTRFAPCFAGNFVIVPGRPVNTLAAQEGIKGAKAPTIRKLRFHRSSYLPKALASLSLRFASPASRRFAPTPPLRYGHSVRVAPLRPFRY
jgi:hypothetical protein